MAFRLILEVYDFACRGGRRHCRLRRQFVVVVEIVVVLERRVLVVAVTHMKALFSQIFRIRFLSFLVVYFTLPNMPNLC